MASQPVRWSEQLQHRRPFNAEQRQLPHLVTDVRPSSFEQRPSTFCAQQEGPLAEDVESSQHQVMLPTSVIPYNENAPTAVEAEGHSDMEPPLEEDLSHVLSVGNVIIPYDASHPHFRRFMASMSINSHSVGSFSLSCSACHALHWKDEESSHHSTSHTFLLCCHHGKVMLPFLQLPLEPLYDFYIANTVQAKLFQQNIVQYNAALAFTLLGISPDNAVNLQPGPPVFRVHGELMHWSGCLLPDTDSLLSYAQLYIYDSQQALAFRMNHNPNLDEATMAGLQAMIEFHNPYFSLYMEIYEILHNRNVPDYTAQLITLPGNDARWNELPTADEVAVILPDTPQQVEQSSRDIILTLRHHSSSSFPLQRINEGHAAYAPTHYVLLFPYGESGWHWDINQAGSLPTSVVRKVTLLQYVSFRLHPRGERTEFSTILHSRRLLHHYLVDMYACIDHARLLYHRTHQQQYQLSTASGMHDALHPSDHTIGSERLVQDRLANIGQCIYLPNSYIGGPRDMYDRYQDGMTVARHYRQIDLFVTMTANPNWPEIREVLLPHQSPHDRPDLIA